MKKILLISALAAVSFSAIAQETYESATVTDQDLNGTARYVGMGGAMEALGADISTMSSNPAGIGMFRRSTISATGGMNISGQKLESMKGDKTTFSFDQIGAVYSSREGADSYLNFGFNYHMSKNFNDLFYATDHLSDASQNKLSFNKFRYSNQSGICYNLLDQLYYDDLHLTVGDNEYYVYCDGLGYIHERKNSGYVGTYDFNISGNIHNKVYLGMTIGIKDIHYKSSTAYAEYLTNDQEYLLLDDRTVTGTGIDIKLGAILRPIETSPFRIGLYVNSPVFYDLKTRNNTDLYRLDTDNTTVIYQKGISSEYKFKLNTPWLFGVSMGHTVGKNLALGVTYELSDYSRIDNRHIEGGYEDDWGDWHDNSAHDRVMNDWTRETLKTVHTLKVGAELKPIPEIALRAGYNYISPKYDVKGYKNGTLDSWGTDCASTTDYTNWKDTHRITFGVGYTLSNNVNFDIAYMYQTTKGEFFPFMSYYENSNGTASDYDNIADRYDVKDNRHKLLATLTYKF